MAGRIQVDGTVLTLELEQKPFLLLADTDRLAVLAHQTLWQSVSQPGAGGCQYLHMFRPEPYFFIQLSIHGIFSGFTVIQSPLGKLPGVLTETPGPHYLAKSVTDNDAHICAKTVAVNHMDSEKAINFNDSIVSQSHVGSNSLFTAFSLDKQMEFSTLSTTALPCLSGYPQKLWISLFETRLNFWKRCFLQPLQSKSKSKNQNKIILNTKR
jgi:hypothetical protein